MRDEIKKLIKLYQDLGDTEKVFTLKIEERMIKLDIVSITGAVSSTYSSSMFRCIALGETTRYM